MPVRFLLEKVPAQCDGVVKADPFLRPMQKYPAVHPAAGAGAPDSGHQRGGQG